MNQGFSFFAVCNNNWSVTSAILEYQHSWCYSSWWHGPNSCGSYFLWYTSSDRCWSSKWCKVHH